MGRPDQVGHFLSGITESCFKGRSDRIRCGDFGRWGGVHVGCGGARMGVVRSGIHRRQNGKLWLELG